MLDQLLKESTEKMNKALQVFEHELGALRTGRANPHLLDGIAVSCYGSQSPIQQLGTVSTPDGSTIAIQPWDTSVLGAIEKAILQANIGLTPNNDGKVIRLHIPALTEQTRKDMVKRANHLAEEGRVAVRNIRRHVNDEIKKNEKDHAITEDDKKRMLDEVQKRTDDHIKKIEALLQAKEKEIMTV
jgi:ribosome recycling factor